ncbi:NDR1/HIN1-like protein 6 [Momordica charantia]|uniref:NDR1/HIN1-like protein 6 n=1 Tax=Momordica charantia TaxID=3673 RepID=A0A6J1CBS7_MOMCH|nr:NDR1/HIN1-like protein 6 [Momordica charantia]
MALPDHHQIRIHPVADLEQPPPEKGRQQLQIVPPKKKRYSCLCRWLCWSLSIILVLLIVVGAVVGILYLVFKPKIPAYSVDSLNISDLRLNFDMSLYARFDVKITAYNPNEKIGIYYEKGGVLSVWYTENKLCEGSLPAFYHGHRNKTALDVDLTGRTVYGSTLMAALVEQQRTGRIPLQLRAAAPVAVKLGKLKLKKVKILGECLLVVDSLTANNAISIKASNCKFKLKL